MTLARRTPAIVASLLALAAVGSPAARAHFCATPVQIEVDTPSSVTVGVAAEERPITRVDVRIPDGFDLDEVTDPGGWTADVSGDRISFTAGTIPAFGCTYFTISGRATRKAALAFPLDVHADDGSVREYRSRELGAQYAAQLVYAGVDPPEEEATGDPSDGGSSTGRTIVTAVLASAGVAAGAWALRYAVRKAAPPPVPHQQRRRPPQKKRKKKR